MPESHAHAHQHEGHGSAVDFWEGFYGGEEKPWTGRPNQVLVDELAARPPGLGTALDLGCGTGADVVWLAQQGWRVTGVDISSAALRQAAAAAAAAGVADRVTWQQVDLDDDFPAGSWDLVTASYLHSPVAFGRDGVLARAAAAVAPGGTLLVIGHQSAPSWTEAPPGMTFPTVGEVLEVLPAGGWEVGRAEAVVVPLTAPDGTPGHRTDNLVRLRRVEA